MRFYALVIAALIVAGSFFLLVAAPGLGLIGGLLGIVVAFALIYWAFVLATDEVDEVDAQRRGDQRRSPTAGP